MNNGIPVIQKANPFKDKRVFISVPSNSMVHADMAFSMAAMVNHARSAGIQIALNNQVGADISYSRNMQVYEALKSGATHILFVDSDMVFPPYSLQALLEACIEENRKIVGVTVPKRIGPFSQVAKDLQGNRLKIELGDKRDVIEIGEIGTGMLMADLSVFEKIEFPWFDSHFNVKPGMKLEEKFKSFVSEDLDFIKKARAKGYKAYCDVTLSMQVQHLATLKLDFTSEDLFKDGAEARAKRAGTVLAKHIEKNKQIITPETGHA